MKKLVVTLLVIAIAATFINDLGNYLQAFWALDSGTNEIAREAADAARKERNVSKPGGVRAVNLAKERGFVLYGYQSKGNEVEVWTLKTVEGTWVAGPLLAWTSGKPLDTPFQITEHDTAYIP